MKNKIKNILIIIISLLLLYFIITKKEIIKISIIYGTSMWFNYLVPSLFPFFIISDILINYNITLYIPKYITNILKRLFNITDKMLTVFLLSLISGFPSSARNIKTLYEEKSIEKEEANHILIFSHFANPVFILVTIPMLLNINTSHIILLSHYLSNIIIGLIFKNKFTHKEDIKIINHNKYNLSNILIASVNKTIDSLLSICGIVVTFYLLGVIITTTLNLNLYNSTLLKGLFEITSGIDLLKNINISNIYKTIITTCLLSFGGLSIHMQTKSYLINTDIDYKYFLIGRIYQTIISGFIAYILLI